MYQIHEVVAPCPMNARNARVGNVVSGDGGDWLPVAAEVEPGKYLSGVVKIEPGFKQVVFPVPVWTCPDVAFLAATRVAGVVSS